MSHSDPNRARRRRRPPGEDLLGRLGRRRLVAVTGKGGVGKTALSAVLACALADRGRRVLLLEVDPRENLHEMLAVPPSGGETAEVRGGLWLRHLRPRTVLEQRVRERVRVELLARRVLASPVFHHFVEGAPGLKELALLDYARRSTRGEAGAGTPEVDLVVLDAPATGHGLALLRAPLLVGDVLDRGPIGRLAEELAAFVRDPDATGVVVVTHAEEMPVQEALELGAEVRRWLHREPELLVVNAVYPAGARTGLPGERRAVNERWLAHLEREWTGPHAELPLLALERGPALVEALRERLEARLAPARETGG